jgi:hypothetical protein
VERRLVDILRTETERLAFQCGLLPGKPSVLPFPPCDVPVVIHCYKNAVERHTADRAERIDHDVLVVTTLVFYPHAKLCERSTTDGKTLDNIRRAIARVSWRDARLRQHLLDLIAWTVHSAVTATTNPPRIVHILAPNHQPEQLRPYFPHASIVTE